MYDWLTRFIKRVSTERSSGDPAAGLSVIKDDAATDGLFQPTEDDRGQSGPDSHETTQLTTDLNDCMAALRTACKQVESDFLEIGEKLQSIHAQSTRMTDNAQSAVQDLGLETDASVLSTITRTAHRALDNFELEHSGMTEKMVRFGAICQHLHQLDGMTEGLSGIAKALKMVAINISIESSRADESRESFLVLSREIRALSNTVADQAKTLRDEIRAIKGKLENAQHVMGTNLGHFSLLAGEARGAADTAAPECQALMDESLNVLQKVGADGTSISQSTGQIVVNLQIHDNVSQRIEHIVDALADAVQMLQKMRQDSECEESVAAVHATIELQAAQLANIITDIDDVFQKCSLAFDLIADKVGNITAGILQMAWGEVGGRTGHKSEAGSIGSLMAALEKIRALIGQSDEAIDELKAIGKDATEAVSRIGDHMEQVRKVNFDIHLKSLNAIFKSTHLGNRGRAIGVLVQEMKELATQSNELVERIESINSAIMNEAGHLQTEASDEQAAEVVGIDQLDNSLDAFSRTGAVFSRHADEMAELGRSFDAMITSAGRQLTFLQPFADRLRDQKECLTALRARLAPWVTASGGSTTVLLDKTRLAQRYTMQQERDIHTVVLDNSAIGADAPENNGAGDFSSDSELGDNVELF